MQSKMQITKLMQVCLIGSTALLITACTTTPPESVEQLIEVVGTTVPGAQGKTEEDQDRIDAHVARSCAAGLYPKELCAFHTDRSAERREELGEEAADLGELEYLS